ncbi:polyprenyl synthetase family protein [Paenimyroides tangerinum]|uniref:Polyprenyl synthetase family protein n=1 Tax=Paenimyroides tangerinum TaxID=2488728 RepID=A0A3P3W929_9FLAO|nr:polyprenyl synthetase family protein [Paenimyroides tangerinum]RRJ91655.1 polyprenyl synthetase family protein [Paenimyroides tangerinum]
MNSITNYKEITSKYISLLKIEKTPNELYDPIRYILSLGGKQLRPVLTLFSAEIFGTDYKKALYAATAIELFHNFSLIHDDIMDDAPLRRGNKTVHEKWNINTAILSGDAMLILAYQYFENYEPKIFKELAQLFSKTALEVCEGQQMDINFETRNDVSVSEYIKMIEYKTAVLVGAALKMGAIVAESTEDNKNAIYNFGLNLGIAFQLQDDYLDAFGDSASFGKQIGGDILENKKTYLYLLALEKANKEDKEELYNWFSKTENNGQEKIDRVKSIFEKTEATSATQNQIEIYTNNALEILDNLDINTKHKNELRTFALDLMNRSV